MSDAISKELFREDGWAIIKGSVGLSVLHNYCKEARVRCLGRAVKAPEVVVPGESGEKCYWCNEPIPKFIQQMWTFTNWCHR